MPTSSSWLFQKASKNSPAKPRQINSRISPLGCLKRCGFKDTWAIRQVKQDRDKRICYKLGPIDRVREGHVPPNPENLEHSIFQFPKNIFHSATSIVFLPSHSYSKGVHRPDAVLGFGRNAPGSPLICHLSGSRTCSAAPIGPQSAPARSNLPLPEITNVVRAPTGK